MSYAKLLVPLALAALGLVACNALIGTRDLELASGDDGGGGTTLDGSMPPTDSGNGQNPDGGQQPDTGNVTSGDDGGSGGDGNVTTGDDGGGNPDTGPCNANVSTDTHNCGRCGHDCLTGDCDAGVCQPVAVAKAQGSPFGIAVDSTYVYWSAVQSSTVMRAKKDGTGLVALASGDDGGASTPWAVAADGKYVYWTNDQNPNDIIQGQVVSCDPSNCQGTKQVLRDHLNDPGSVAVDDAGVYWEEDFAANLGRVSKSGTGGGNLVTGQGGSGEVATDGTYAYFVTDNGVLGRVSNTAPVSADGGAFTTIYAPPSGFSPWGLAVDGTNVYWTEYGDPGAVLGAPKAGLTGGAQPISFSTSEHWPEGIVSDGVNVYWANNGPNTGANGADVYVDGTIESCPIAGCPASGPRVLASKQVWPKQIALDADAIYWTDNGTYGNGGLNGPANGTIMKVAKP